MGTATRTVMLLVVALGVGLAASGWAAPPGTEPAPPAVTVHNAAGDAGEGLVGVVSESLTTRAQAMPQLRASVGRPWALEAEIASAVVSRDRAQVKVMAALTPPAGGLRYMAEAVGEGHSGAEAAMRAAEEAMENLGVCVNAKGSVYYYGDRALEAWISIGSGQGLRPHARVVFLRGGEQVGQGQVVTVKDADAIVRVDRDVPAGSVMVGDDVRVVTNGPRSAVRAVLAHERRQSGTAAFLAGALLWGLIAAAR